MCLEVVGDQDDGECNGKTVGQPCNHSGSPEAICAHDPRSGSWMCSAPKTEESVFASCQGKEKGTPCSYTAKIDPRFDHGMDSGLIEGACDLYHASHTVMMCLAEAPRGNPHKAPCVGKTVGDTCEYGNSKTGGVVCCTTLQNAGVRQRFCKKCDMPGAKTPGECTARVNDKYLGCFRRAEDSLVFKTCHGVAKGSSCMYETAASRYRNTPAYNTTGACLPHMYHQGVMCLAARGDNDDGECNGKTVGESCAHSESQNAICSHDPRLGSWMCSAPKAEEPVFAVCEGKKKGTLCKYTAKIDPRFDHSMEAGLGQGVCGLLHETNTAMMCLPVSDLMRSGVPIASAPDKEEDAGSQNLIIAVVATAAASLFVGGIAGVGGALVMQRYMRQENPATVFPPAGDCHPSSVEQGKEEPRSSV